VVLVAAAPAVALGALAGPSVFELTAGYQVLRVSTGGSTNTHSAGFAIDGARYFNQYALVAELGLSSDSTEVPGTSLSSSYLHVGGGPRILFVPDGRLRPYIQVLAGVAHGSSTTEQGAVSVERSDTAFMVQPGLGMTIVMGRAWALVGAIDYRRSFFSGAGFTNSNEVRGLLGVRLILQ
jgi:hypothetical protein